MFYHTEVCWRIDQVQRCTPSKRVALSSSQAILSALYRSLDKRAGRQFRVIANRWLGEELILLPYRCSPVPASEGEPQLILQQMRGSLCCRPELFVNAPARARQTWPVRNYSDLFMICCCPRAAFQYTSAKASKYQLSFDFESRASSE